MIKRRSAICVMLVLAGFLFIPLSVHADMQIGSDNNSLTYYFDIMTKAASDSGFSTIRLFIKVAYDDLQFIRDGEQFKARYELTASVLNASDELVESDIKTHDVNVATFEETNSPFTYAFSEVSFDLEPASYQLIIGLTDLDSRRSGRNKVDIDLIDYWKYDFGMSDLLLADTTWTGQDGRLMLQPNVLWDLGTGSKMITVYFEVYSTFRFESVPVQLVIRTREDQPVYEWKQDITIQRFRTPVIQNISREKIQAGIYRIEIQVGRDRVLTRRIKNLTIRWMNLPVITSDLDKAIDQLRYIASPKEIKAMKNAEGNKKAEMFEDYWKSVDPTPGTSINERMIEYYRRIEYANENFSGYTEGWLTDRALVYIVLGPPDDIERYPFEQDSKPYIIWLYYLKGREFVFIDQTGFGDYRLKNPLWEVYSAK